MTESSPLWYQNAIIYQLHIKAFFDANGDGTGDFAGLTRKLDHITELGATAIWLLPFYPSPLRDDGYDIADYKSIHKRYGNMRDFRRFLREAHRRDLKVITELVINHTSDQHPWFQKARRAKPGSAWRNYYVWSDTDQKYLGTRIIFTDTETSNWSWDPEAKAYYWHRFFSHQPDLNFDNPRVVDSILNVMKFWLDMGVDGLRLDAIPYLCEREGTNNENLPETHDILKKIRRWLDDNYSNRMLLGEANQWPEDVLPYFGTASEPECHMAFHFPLMPRMYMALAQEDRHPITDIMAQTPEIPANTQWAIFLRNHDELTLEMVTDQERDYLWSFYASDPRMRVNVGIRRRLAPLLDNDRNKMQLLNSMLMSMPGTPIVYYGDEIGMGDNIFLGDRDSVRTPMQWTPDRNGGFSSADPASLYLPAIMDPIYGYEALNVEAQHRNPSSFLNWIQRLIAVRKSQSVFGKGSLRFLFPGNRKVLAYIREDEDDAILCIANLSRSAQPVELDLSEFRDRVPVELLGESAFPPIGELPYFLTLSPHGFYWFQLTRDAEPPAWHQQPAGAPQEFHTLVLPQRWHSLLEGRGKAELENRLLPEFIAAQRWFAAKETGIAAVILKECVDMTEADNGCLLSIFSVHLNDGACQYYFLPLSLQWEDVGRELLPPAQSTVARTRSANRLGYLLDAAGDENAIRTWLEHFRGQAEGGSGIVGRALFTTTSAFPGNFDARSAAIKPTYLEQSNSTSIIDDTMILKTYRHLQPGLHPEFEVGRFLTEVAGYKNSPSLFGALEIEDESGERNLVAILQSFVTNQGDGWGYTLGYLERFFHDTRYASREERAAQKDIHVGFTRLMRTLGLRVAELHQALATPTADPAFSVEPVTAAWLDEWRRRLLREAAAAHRTLQHHTGSNDAGQVERFRALLLLWPALERCINELMPDRVTALLTRTHGDLHLGQVLVAEHDFHIIDFEGEPARPLAERRAKQMPLRDIAGLLRSLDYAARTAAARETEKFEDDHALVLTLEWLALSRQALLDGYRQGSDGCRFAPAETGEFESLIALFTVEKVLYEILYEANNRPDWLIVPVDGLIEWISRHKS